MQHSILLATIGFMSVIAGLRASFASECAQEIVTANTRFVRDRLGTLRSCEDKKLKDQLPADTLCLLEPSTAAKLAKQVVKLHQRIGKRCGGADATCDGIDDVAPADLGWPAACPNYANGPCDFPIVDCDDVASCLECVAHAVAQDTVARFYDQLEDDGGDLALRKCQRTIGKRGVKYARARAKALEKCWAARLRGDHADPCPDPGDGEAAAAILDEETAATAAICEACGGTDELCGGATDRSPYEIGFQATCNRVIVPDGTDCATILDDTDNGITTLATLVNCGHCTTAFAVDCADRLAVHNLAVYPSACNPTFTCP